MIIKLKDIADVFSGNTFREKIETSAIGDCAAIQLKDINKSYTQILNTAHVIQSRGISTKQFLKTGDILFIAKGANNFALTYNGNFKAVASSVFFIIRPNRAIISDYICWYINQEKAQGYLHTGKEGSMITNINKQTLENLEIEIPSIENQKRIVEMNKLWLLDKELQANLTHKKEQLVNTLLNSLVNGKN